MSVFLAGLSQYISIIIRLLSTFIVRTSEMSLHMFTAPRIVARGKYIAFSWQKQ